MVLQCYHDGSWRNIKLRVAPTGFAHFVLSTITLNHAGFFQNTSVQIEWGRYHHETPLVFFRVLNMSILFFFFNFTKF